MGFDHCAWLADDGSVWTSGANFNGQLGLGDEISRTCPSRVPNLPPISSVCPGDSVTLCLDCSGNLWSFGWNSYGQLGLGDTTARSSPEMVPGIPPVLSFSSHDAHTTSLCEDASIWVFGRNANSQLGLGHQITQNAPVKLPTSYFPNEIISTQCGSYHSLFLTSEGQVLSCGSNGAGQLGLGDFTTRSTPTLIPNMKNCIKIACGGRVSCMIDNSYRLWVSGSHKSSQATPLCFPSVGSIHSISVGHQQTLCINLSGELWGWGFDQPGNVFINPCKDPVLLKNNIQAALCLGKSSFIRNVSGDVFYCGEDFKQEHGVNPELTFMKFPEKQFRMWFPVPFRKFSQKSARSALPLP